MFRRRVPELERRDREGGRVQLEKIRTTHRSRGVGGIEAETGKYVRDAIFDWQPVEVTENWCDGGRSRCADYKSSSTVLDSLKFGNLWQRKTVCVRVCVCGHVDPANTTSVQKKIVLLQPLQWEENPATNTEFRMFRLLSRTIFTCQFCSVASIRVHVKTLPRCLLALT